MTQAPGSPSRRHHDMHRSMPHGGDTPFPRAARPQIAGILNMTEDSFSDGGRWLDPDRAFERALEASPKPIVAHCRSGTRTYLLWATGQALGGKADPAKLVADAAAKGYDIKSLPDLVTRLKAR